MGSAQLRAEWDARQKTAQLAERLKFQAVLLDVWCAQEEMAGRDCHFARERVQALFALAAEGREVSPHE